MIYRITRFVAWFILRFFFRLQVVGKECIPKKGPFILAANHISNFDPPAVSSACPRVVNFLGKEELFKNKFLKAYFRALKTIPLKRSKTDISVIKTSLEVLKKEPLMIFPQGTRGKPLDEFKSGVGFLCRKAKVPVFVAKVFGTDRVLPKGARFVKFGRVKVVFAAVDNITDEDSNETIAGKVMEKIKSL